MGSLWNFDLAFGNVDYVNEGEFQFESPMGFWVKEHKWYERLFQDPAFVSKVKTHFLFFRDNQNFILDKIGFYDNYLKFA